MLQQQPSQAAGHSPAPAAPGPPSPTHPLPQSQQPAPAPRPQAAPTPRQGLQLFPAEVVAIHTLAELQAAIVERKRDIEIRTHLDLRDLPLKSNPYTVPEAIRDEERMPGTDLAFLSWPTRSIRVCISSGMHLIRYASHPVCISSGMHLIRYASHPVCISSGMHLIRYASGGGLRPEPDAPLVTL